MKTFGTAALGAVLLTAIASPSKADNIVVWRTIKGVAQAGNIPRPRRAVSDTGA